LGKQLYAAISQLRPFCVVYLNLNVKLDFILLVY